MNGDAFNNVVDYNGCLSLMENILGGKVETCRTEVWRLNFNKGLRVNYGGGREEVEDYGDIVDAIEEVEEKKYEIEEEEFGTICGKCKKITFITMTVLEDDVEVIVCGKCM